MLQLFAITTENNLIGLAVGNALCSDHATVPGLQLDFPRFLRTKKKR